MRHPLYDLLGLDPGATEREIKCAFRRLAKLHHPDRNPGDCEAAQRFKELVRAFQVLSDPERRARYDLEHDVRCRGGFGRAGFDVGDLLQQALRRRAELRRTGED